MRWAVRRQVDGKHSLLASGAGQLRFPTSVGGTATTRPSGLTKAMAFNLRRSGGTQNVPKELVAQAAGGIQLAPASQSRLTKVSAYPAQLDGLVGKRKLLYEGQKARPVG
jgi:hypothetical protein